jgi:hypothetical protein
MGCFLVECGLKDRADGFEISFQVPKVVRGPLYSMAATQGLQFFAAGCQGQGTQSGAAGFEAVCDAVKCGRIVRFDRVA